MTSPRTTALRALRVSQKPECRPTDKLELHLIINSAGESEVQVGGMARTRRKREKRSKGHVIIKDKD